ncbi:MAG: sugar phosphate isomerase/epimerase [Verrucomicrobiae bacterium]|nr:sugar phosphate isomerase/epimerase [Verrucomicrobiae bacterium]
MTPAAAPHSDLSRLCIHTATTKPWPIETAMEKYAAASVSGITVWRDALENRNPSRVGKQLRNCGLEVVSLCRGGFFPALTEAGQQQAIDDNRRAIEQAAALGAPLIVLVCGAVLGQSLDTSRQQIIDGIAAILPDAEAAGIRLAIEPLHPMYADDRSAINTMAQAHAACDQLNHPLVGIAVDVYHVWWDDDLPAQIALAGEKDRLFAFHICDWLTPTRHLLTDRGLMGEGCIDLRGIRAMVEATGFSGFNEVEIFSTRWWESDQDDYLAEIVTAYREKS